MSGGEPPAFDRWSHLFAVCLEVLILSRLMLLQDWTGLGLCLLYGWWSATWAFVRDYFLPPPKP